MTKSPAHDLKEYKIQASVLLKQFRSDDEKNAFQAARRFQSLPHLIKFSPQEILQLSDRIKRKHALRVIAVEHHFDSWVDLKRTLELKAARRSVKECGHDTSIYPKQSRGFLNHWFGQYAAARTHLEAYGGYLLPFKNHYFICQSDYIQTLGLDPTDPDWERIAWDWVKPADQDAWTRLKTRLQISTPVYKTGHKFKMGARFDMSGQRIVERS